MPRGVHLDQQRQEIAEKYHHAALSRRVVAQKNKTAKRREREELRVGDYERTELLTYRTV